MLFAYNLCRFVGPVALGKSSLGYLLAISNSLFWLIWYGFTGAIGRLSGGADHPPFEPGELGRGRRAVAWLCLIMFIALFMPTPYAAY